MSNIGDQREQHTITRLTIRLITRSITRHTSSSTASTATAAVSTRSSSTELFCLVHGLSISHNFSVIVKNNETTNGLKMLIKKNEQA